MNRDAQLESGTVLEFEVDGQFVLRLRDFVVPAVGDVLTVPPFFAEASKPYNVEVKRRHWVVDRRQSLRQHELRCVLLCEKTA